MLLGRVFTHLITEVFEGLFKELTPTSNEKERTLHNTEVGPKLTGLLMESPVGCKLVMILKIKTHLCALLGMNSKDDWSYYTVKSLYVSLS